MAAQGIYKPCTHRNAGLVAPVSARALIVSDLDGFGTCRYVSRLYFSASLAAYRTMVQCRREFSFDKVSKYDAYLGGR